MTKEMPRQRIRGKTFGTNAVLLMIGSSEIKKEN